MITYKAETIWSFECGDCKRWWSIQSLKNGSVRLRGETMACPHCGVKGELLPDAPAWLSQEEIDVILSGITK